MEQLQTVLAVVKKHHFWILAGLVLLVSLAVYTIATGALKEEYQSRKSKIDSAFQKANMVKSELDHPNQKKIENWNELHEDQSQKVLDSWKILYEKQEKENPWPSVLSKKFLAWLDKYKEKPDQQIPVRYREEYQNFIQQQLPKLFELVNYRHMEYDEEDEKSKPAARARPGAGAAMPGGAMATGQPEGRLVGVVDWSEGNRSIIMEQYNFATRPSSSRIRLAQEDYWVYQAVLNIIKSTNREATTHSAAAVKEIELLQIGQQAVKTMQSDQGAQLFNTGSSGTSSMGMGMEMGMPGGGMGGEMGMPGGGGMGMPGGGMGMPGGGMGMPGGGMGMPGGGMGMPGGGGGMTSSMDSGGGDGSLSQEETLMLNGRYVKESLEPLPAGEHEYAEFKMMPIFMRLKIDQRKIPELLVECANSTMPVEVKQLRINPLSGSSLSMGGMGGRSRGGMSEMGMGMPGMGGGGRARTATGQAGEENNPYVVSIELRGIIYLYNLPDKEKLATGTFADEEKADAAATPDDAAPDGGATTPDGTTPAATTTPPGTAPATGTPPGTPPGMGMPGTTPPGTATPATAPGPVGTPPVSP